MAENSYALSNPKLQLLEHIVAAGAGLALLFYLRKKGLLPTFNVIFKYRYAKQE